MKIRKRDGTVVEVDDGYVLMDGEALTVPMTMMDSGRSLVHDGHGNPAGQRPGFLYSDTGADTAYVVRETLYREYANGIEQRWRSERWQGQKPSNARYLPDQKPLNERHLPSGDVAAAYAQYNREVSERWK